MFSAKKVYFCDLYQVLNGQMALGNNIKRDRLIPNNDNKPLFEDEKEDDLLRFFERNKEKSKPSPSINKIENTEDFEKKLEIKLPTSKETPLYKNDKQIFISQDDFSELNLFASELVSQSNFIKKNLTEITDDFAEISAEISTENFSEKNTENTAESYSNNDFDNQNAHFFDNKNKNILQHLEQNEKEFSNTNKAFSLLDESKLKALTSAENAEKSLDTFIMGISEVQKTSRVLTEISAQSGVLAINAAIEAARVGDAGRSFVVIADEVRKISDNAKKSSDNIEDVLCGLQKDMQLALKALFQMKNYLENQQFAINQLTQNIENITQNNTNMVDMLKESQKENQKESQKYDKKDKSNEKIRDKSSNFSAENSKKLNKKSKDITEKLENINHSAQNLHSIAKQLSENLKNMD